MDHGIPQMCEATGPDGKCTVVSPLPPAGLASASHAGLQLGGGRQSPTTTAALIRRRRPPHATPLAGQDEHYRGLWEVPVWVLQTSKYPVDAYAMDPNGDVAALLKLNFDAVRCCSSGRTAATLPCLGSWPASSPPRGRA